MKLSKLKYLDVIVNGEQCASLVDSGAEIGILSERLAHKLQLDTCAHINVRGVFGDPMRVPLVNVTLKRYCDTCCDKAAKGMQVLCAVAPLKDVTFDAILPTDVIASLKRLSVMNVSLVKVDNSDVDDECNDVACLMSEVEADGDYNGDDKTDDCDNDVVNANETVTCESECGNYELLKVQVGDVSLSVCQEMAKLSKDNRIISHSLLCHTEHVEGQKTFQLCVAKSLITVCDAMLDVFPTVRDPFKVISHNGSDLNSQLAQELLCRLGCSPVVDTPGHPQADRPNKSYKNCDGDS